MLFFKIINFNFKRQLFADDRNVSIQLYSSLQIYRKEKLNGVHAQQIYVLYSNKYNN